MRNYRSCQPADIENRICFEILGFDILLDKGLNPILLEVNHAPSFGTDSVLDLEVKKRVLSDTFTLLGLSLERKKAKLSDIMSDKASRVFTRLSKEQKLEKRDQILKELAARDLDVEQLQTGYVRVFPPNDEKQHESYNQMLAISYKAEHSVTLKALMRAEERQKVEDNIRKKEERRKERRKEKER